MLYFWDYNHCFYTEIISCFCCYKGTLYINIIQFSSLQLVLSSELLSRIRPSHRPSKCYCFTTLWFAVATGGNSSWLTVHQDKTQLCVKTFHLSSTLQCHFPCISGALHRVSFYRPIVSVILIYGTFYYLLCFASFLSRVLYEWYKIHLACTWDFKIHLPYFHAKSPNQ